MDNDFPMKSGSRFNDRYPMDPINLMVASTPLKNDGVKVSWEKCSKPPTSSGMIVPFC
jgi:hypothetical protein